MESVEGRGRTLLGPSSPDDTGEASPAVREALAAYDADPTRYAAALVALAGSRLLVPVVAVLGESEVGEDGLARDKSSDMAAVLLQHPDGRTALLAFTGTDSLAAWNPKARPVPVPVRTAAVAAVQDGADALAVDLVGPARIVVEGDTLRRLAAGWTPVLHDGRGVWIGPAPE